MRYGFMLVLCFAVIGGMSWVLVWFFRRLAKIENERWGAKVGLTTFDFKGKLTRLFRKKPARPVSKKPT
jgi:hypothetical protein